MPIKPKKVTKSTRDPATTFQKPERLPRGRYSGRPPNVVRMGPIGSIIIPGHIRDQIGLGGAHGAYFEITTRNGKLVLKPVTPRWE